MLYRRNDIAETIRQERHKRHWTQAMLAKRADISVPRISMLEKGRLNPQLSTLMGIFRALDIELMPVPKNLVPAVQALTRKRYNENESGKDDFLLTADESD